MIKAVALVGPTAAGKTSLAFSLCRQFNGEIISVDSRQAYQEMDIGTGKDPSSVPTDISIHLYDLVHPNQTLNAFDFSLLSWSKIDDLIQRGRTVFLVGGTGFYLDVILGRRILANAKADSALRKSLEELSLGELVKKLAVLDPDRLSKIDKHNPHRLIRAIEVALHRSLVPKLETQPLPLNCLVIGLTADNDYLYERADRRIEQMIKQGLLGEVSGLVQKYGWEAPGLKTLGYSQLRDFLAGHGSLEESISRLKFDTHSYIRRQKTYFKKNREIVWFDIRQLGFEVKVAEEVESFLRR